MSCPDILPPEIFPTATLCDQQWVTVVLLKLVLQTSPGDIVTLHEQVVIGIENVQLLQHGEKVTQIVKTAVADVPAEVQVGPEGLRLQAVAELTQDEDMPSGKSSRIMLIL